jgi:ribosome modulation factor
MIETAETLLTDTLLQDAKRFAEKWQVGLSTVGKAAMHDGNFFRDLEAGKRNITVRTYDRLGRWFQDNWQRGLKEEIHERVGDGADGLHSRTLGESQDVSPHETQSPSGRKWLEGWHDGQKVNLAGLGGQ